jgi:hypothetical protein
MTNLWWKTVHHRSRVILDILFVIELDRPMMKTDRHRTALACVARASHAGGCFCWRCFPRVHAIAGCIGDGSGMCHLLTAQRGHLWFLHVSGSYYHMLRPCCSTNQFSIGTCVVLRLGHVSLLHWTMCHIFIGPRGMTTIPRMSFFYSTTCLNVVRPHVSILLGHMSRLELPTSFSDSTTW